MLAVMNPGSLIGPVNFEFGFGFDQILIMIMLLLILYQCENRDCLCGGVFMK